MKVILRGIHRVGTDRLNFVARPATVELAFNYGGLPVPKKLEIAVEVPGSSRQVLELDFDQVRRGLDALRP